jgi:hypothetical protein
MTPRCFALSVNTAVGVGGVLFLLCAAAPVTLGTEGGLQAGVIAAVAGPTLVAAGFAGVVFAFLCRAGGIVWNTVGAVVVLLVGSAVGLVLDLFLLSGGWMPSTEPPPGPSRADLLTALGTWVLFTMGLLITAEAGLRRPHTS